MTKFDDWTWIFYTLSYKIYLYIPR